MIPFLRRRTRTERGAVAIMVAALSVVLFGVAALAVDVASQVDEKQDIRNQLDAAATAAAYYLGPGQQASVPGHGSLKDAVDQATAFYAKNGQGALDPSAVDFWCVVAKDPTKTQPAWLQVPGVCNPDGISAAPLFPVSSYQNETRAWDGRKFNMTCNASMCAIPCGLKAAPSNGWDPGNSAITTSPIKAKPITCNTIRIGAARDVPFTFGKVIGVDQGSTGAQVAVACRGVCGQIAPNPMNVVVVTDRTASMSTSDLHALITGVKSMLTVMSPDQQYVSLGVIGRSSQTSRASFSTCTSSSSGGTMTSSSGNTSGLWVPLAFYNNYLNSDRSGVSTTSNLVKALNCLDPNNNPHVAESYGTYLASPLKAAARYVTGLDSDNNNIASLNAAEPRTGTVRNVIIFETDGQPAPSDNVTANCGSTSLTGAVSGCGTGGYDLFAVNDTMTVSPTGGATASSAGAVGSSYGSQYCNGNNPQTCYALSYALQQATGTNVSSGDLDCQNFVDVANNFKAADPTNMVITVGFNLGTTTCGSASYTSGVTWLSDVEPTTGSWSTSATGQRKSDCLASTTKDGSTPDQALALKSNMNNCKLTLKLTYTRWTPSGSTSRMVTETLASGSGTATDGPGLDDSGDHCSTADGRDVENTDNDLFFCAASGDQMAAIFQTIASKLTTGVKLINLPM